MTDFLPITRQEMLERGWEQPDFVYVSGDAYVDHPSFGAAIISRLLESQGYKVAMLSQPNWKNCEDFKRFGRPKYGFMVSAGNIDSMVAHYTSAKKRRHDDAYSPGNQAGKRPDRAVIVYCNRIREAYGDVPIVIGGIEASLRRFAHYDYWDDKVRRSILFDSGADILSYGMGEHQTIEIAKRLAAGEPVKEITDILGTCVVTDFEHLPEKFLECDSFEKVSMDKVAYARSSRLEFDEHDYMTGRNLVQRCQGKYLLQNKPAPPLTQKELDTVYSLPYQRMYHPSYEAQGGVPAIKEVEFSIAHNRGCFGSCNFCALAFHQGRYITCRSEQSVLNEARNMTYNPRFKGYIHDIGGPTADFRRPSCEKQKKYGMCKGKKCLAPTPCKQLVVDHSEYIDLLRKVREIPGVKRVFVRSGIRFDYVVADKDEKFLDEIVRHHVSGQLKVAPEHCAAAVLDKMGKPHIETYQKFQEKFYRLTKAAGKEQYLVPYLMSSHPGSTLKSAVELALFLKKNHIRPEQVQDFYPTPATVSTCMFYTGLDPYTMQEVYVPRTPEEKAMQRALLQYFRPQNREIVVRALVKAHRTDLIGHGENCLIAPDAKTKKLLEQLMPQRSKQHRTTRYHSKAPRRGAGRNSGIPGKGKTQGRGKQ